jgi:calcineurin-like phosphoesterase family protein
MNTWFTSDHHFGHARIIEYCERPFGDVNEMNVKMTNYWNELIMPNDIVYYLGDFSFQSDRYIDRLNGKIILIRGNHDKERHLHLFDLAVDGIEMKIGEFRCFLTHWPIEVWKKYKAGAPELEMLNIYDHIICGHVHEKWRVKEKNINVGVDVWDFKPIHMDELVRFMRKIKGEKNA